MPTHAMFTDAYSVVANEGQRIDIPDGCILENRQYYEGFFRFVRPADIVMTFAGLVSGNLNMIVSPSPRMLDKVLTCLSSRSFRVGRSFAAS